MPACLQCPRQRSILVVDDDQEMGRLVRRNMEGEDTRVAEATTGLECIRLLNEEKVDLLILDVRLPDFSGWGILSLLRLSESRRVMPVILASVEPPDNALMVRLRPDDYIQKPFDIRDLLVRVEKIIEKRESRQ
jgi:two-component system alkaline phosphatase synthesis response regulator PhoP